MAHTVSGLIRKAPHIQAGQNNNGNYTMFCFELAEFNKGTQGKEDSYTNYSAAIFAKTAAQIGYYNTSLVEGNFIVVNCEKLKVDVNESNGKQYIKLQMEGARLEGAKYIENNQQAAPQQQGGYSQQAPQQQAPQQGGFVNQGQTPQQQGGYAQSQEPRDPQGFTRAQGGFSNQ